MDRYIFQNDGEEFSLRWIQGAKPEYAGIQGDHPYILSGRSMLPSATINLYAARSRSFPYYSKKGTWEHLIPTWSFRDEDGNRITSITVTGTSAEGTSGYTYTGSAWFVDELPTLPRTSTYLWATMELSGNTSVSGERGHESYTNSMVFDTIEAKTARIYPDYMLFSTNGKIALSSEYHWTNHITPVVITLHSNYYDLLKKNSNKIDIVPGIIYDFPYYPSASVPFVCVSNTKRTKEDVVVGVSSVDGKIVYDEEGEPIPVTTENYYYQKSPIVAYEKYPYEICSAYLETSADGDAEHDPLIPEIPIPESSAYFKAPAFRQNDDSPDKFFIGGHTIGYITMPDKSFSAGEVYHATIPIDESAPAYLPPYTAWICAPDEAKLYIVPAKTLRTEDDSIESPYGNFPIKSISSMKLTSALAQYAEAGRSSAYHVENVHGIYFMAKDMEYNMWTIDIETAKLLKYDAYGDKTDVDVDLNESFWNWVMTSATNWEKQSAKEFYGKEDNPDEFDVENKSLQPSWIVISPEQDVIDNKKPGVYVGYHDSYLVTTHDIHGNIIDADFSNPSGYKGYLYEMDRNRSWTSATMRHTYFDTSEDMKKVSDFQDAEKGFRAEVDNINKPGAMAIWDNLIWITYSSTSKGVNPYTWDDISNETESCLRVFNRDEKIRHADDNYVKCSWDLEFGEVFEDLCIYHGVAYALISNHLKQSKFVSFSISPTGQAEKPKTIIDYGILERPMHLSISDKGVCWFHTHDRNIIAYEIATNQCFIFTNLYKVDEYWKFQDLEDPLSGSMAIHKENPTSGRYFENEFHQIDGMAVDTDSYLWIIDNYCTSPVQVLDTVELLDKAKRGTQGQDVKIVNDVMFDIDSIAPSGAKNAVYVSGSYVDITGQTQYTWSNVRNQDPRMDHPQLFANGDWTGIRYQILLNECYKPEIAVLRSGTNYVMNYDRLRFRKFKESRDLIPDMKSCIRVPKFANSSTKLWEEFAQAMVGGTDNERYHLGRRLYERISNVVKNLHDVEDSTIHGLYAMAESEDVPIRKYDIYAPETLARVLDILSCPHERIWGSRCYCKSNFVEINNDNKDRKFFCDVCHHYHHSNLGFKFGLFDRNLFLDKSPYVVKNPMDSLSKYTVIYPCKDSVRDAEIILREIENGTWDRNSKSMDFYRIPDDFAEAILSIASTDANPYQTMCAKILAIHTQFYILENWTECCFWPLIDTPCDRQNIGIVNWEDNYTTFPEDLNHPDDFYCSPNPEDQNKYGLPTGYAELVLNYLLHNGLMFDKDGKFTEN